MDVVLSGNGGEVLLDRCEGIHIVEQFVHVLAEALEVAHVGPVDRRDFGEQLFAFSVGQDCALVAEVLGSDYPDSGELVLEELETRRFDAHEAGNEDSGDCNRENRQRDRWTFLEENQDGRRRFGFALLALLAEEPMKKRFILL
jgi:hypothetical protein